MGKLTEVYEKRRGEPDFAITKGDFLRVGLDATRSHACIYTHAHLNTQARAREHNTCTHRFEGEGVDESKQGVVPIKLAYLPDTPQQGSANKLKALIWYAAPTPLSSSVRSALLLFTHL
jgi:hypothetical protein